MLAGVFSPGEVAVKPETIACWLCHRHGVRWTDRLLAEHGPDMPVPDLLRLLAAGGRDSAAIRSRHGVAHCPDLAGLFGVPAGLCN
jgi:hypothetical protein